MWSIVLATTLLAGLPKYEVTYVPNDAVIQALADAVQPEEGEAQFTRYVWIHEGTEEQTSAVSIAVNTAWSKASLPIAPRTFAKGRMVALDFRKLFPKDKDLKEGLEDWERLAGQDPFLYVRRLVDVTTYTASDGKQYKHRWDVSFGGHVDLKSAVMLQGLTKSTAPIMRCDFFTVKSLTQIDGGIYYKLAGIKKSDDKNLTDFEFFLKQHGVDRKQAVELRAERRAAIFKSRVTGKPRAIEEVHGLLGTVAWTEDPADNNLDPKSHPVLTLLNPKIDAIEAIALRTNGMCSFVLFNGKEELQDVVPDNIAKDHTVPTPYTARLQPAISCIRCHVDGFRTTENDVYKVLKARAKNGFKFTPFGLNAEEADRIAGRYRSKLLKLDLGRNDYGDAVFLATTGRRIAQICGDVQSVDNAFRFQDVNPARACRDLGIIVDDADGVEMLSYLLAPETTPGVNYKEDARIGFLVNDITITSPDWRAVYPDAALRSRIRYEKLAQQLKEQKQ